MDGRYGDDSDSSFSIGNPASKLSITAPRRHQPWKRGTPQDIVWQFENVQGKGNIELHAGGRLIGYIAKDIAVGSVGTATRHAGTKRQRWTVGEYIKLDKRVGRVVAGTYKIKIIVPRTGKYAERTLRILDVDPLSFTPGGSRPAHAAGNCDYSIESVRFLHSIASGRELAGDVIRYSENRARFSVVATIHWNGRLPSTGGSCSNRLEISLNGRVHERRTIGAADARGNIVISKSFYLRADAFAPTLNIGFRIYPGSSQCDSNPANNQRRFRFEMVESLTPARQ
jgi:hypothetical protein